MKTNKNRVVPKLRFPEFRDGGDWSVSPLNKLGKFTGGGTPSKANSAYWQGSYPWISSSDISEESIYQINIRRFITKEAIEQSATKEVPENSILLLSRVGIGKLAISKNPVYTSQDFTSFTPKGDNLLFIAYQLKSKAYKFFDFSQGMGIQGFTKDDISNFLVFTTSLPEQQKIADCLSSLDMLIKAENEQLNTLKEYKAGLLQQLFPAEGETMPKLRFAEFKNAGDWEEVSLIDVTNSNIKWSFIGGPFGSNLKASDYTSDGVRVIQLQNIGDGEFVDDSKIYTSKEKADELLANNIYPNDIIMSKMGDPVGRACIIPDTHERYVMCSDGIRLVVDEEKYSKYFIYSLINSPFFRSLIESKSTGSTRKRIGLSHLKDIQLLAPKLKEQQKIANCLSSLDNLIQAKDEKIKMLKEHKQGLMQQLFPTMDGE